MSRTIVVGLLGTALVAGSLWGMGSCRGESQDRPPEILQPGEFPQSVDAALDRQAEQLAEVVRRLAEARKRLQAQRDELARRHAATSRTED